MRLGAPIFEEYQDPDEWVAAVRRCGYSAAFCPVTPDAGDEVIAAYAEAAATADIVIAEVGAWSNPLSRREDERATAFDKCKASLDLADRIGARCCVNIAGSLGEKWDGPCPDDLTEEAFDLIVDTVREIIDAVGPTRTYYTLETMPWMYPDSADSYLRLLAAINRERFAVHFDPVNLICSPQRYFANAAFVRDCLRKLGPRIRSCHAKDVRLDTRLTVHLDEVRLGMGALDYRAFLTEVAQLGDMPVMLEHLASAEEYSLAADHLRFVAREANIDLF